MSHLLIESDNLLALTLLKKEYEGKINMIYIDPPYGTGYNIFSYNDSFEDYASMMKPRITAARNLMTEDALMFVSINVAGMSSLKEICDEIFGKENFIDYLFWKTKPPSGITKKNSLIRQVEFILIYAKIADKAIMRPATNPNAGKTRWEIFIKGGGQWQRQYRPKQFFPFYYNQATNSLSLERQTDKDIEIFPLTAKGEEGFWRNGVATTTEKLKNGMFRAKKSKNRWMIEQYKVGKEKAPVGNLIDIPSTEGTTELKAINIDFTNPKPVRLMKLLLEIGSEKNSIVMDFFAGSGSFGAAVLELNNEDGGTRQFILINSNEENICSEKTWPRLKTVAQNISDDIQLSYLKLTSP